MGLHENVLAALINEIGEPPQEMSDNLTRLKSCLDDRVPPNHLDRHLLIAAWSIQKLGNLTKKWTSGPTDSPSGITIPFCASGRSSPG